MVTKLAATIALGLNPSDPYTEQPATTSKDEIVELLDRHPGKPGATRARLALRHIYDHSASPMETASSIALSLPTSEGGVGIRGIELNKPLEIPQRLWHCTKARTLKIDTLVTYQRRELGIEYKGGFHDEVERKGADAEREAVLAQMGYRIVTLTSAQFASQLAFHRAMNNIREALGMPRCTDAEHQRSKTNCARHLSATGRARRAKTCLPSSGISAPQHQTCTSPSKTTFFGIFGG